LCLVEGAWNALDPGGVVPSCPLGLNWFQHGPYWFALLGPAADAAGLNIWCVVGLVDRPGLRLVLAHEVSAAAL